MGGRVAIRVRRANSLGRVQKLVVVDIGPDIFADRRARIGMLMAPGTELFASFEDAYAFQRATNPRYTDAMLRHRVQHGTRPVAGGLTWKYDRGLRDPSAPATWSDPIDLWPFWRAIACRADRARRRLGRARAGDDKRMVNENSKRAARRGGRRRPHRCRGDQPAIFRALVDEFLGA